MIPIPCELTGSITLHQRGKAARALLKILELPTPEEVVVEEASKILIKQLSELETDRNTYYATIEPPSWTPGQTAPMRRGKRR